MRETVWGGNGSARARGGSLKVSGLNTVLEILIDPVDRRWYCAGQIGETKSMLRFKIFPNQVILSLRWKNFELVADLQATTKPRKRGVGWASKLRMAISERQAT